MKPLVVLGIAPLARTTALVSATPTQPDGFSRRFVLIEEDTANLRQELATIDAAALLRDPRVELFLGDGAMDRFRAWLFETPRQHTALPTHIVSAGPGTHPSTARCQAALNEATAAQASLHESLRTRVLAAYSGKDRAHWATRFSDGKPLRVLIPISRYSTFVRHSAADLADALTHAGHEATILTEPDPYSRLTTPAYLHAFDTFRPDLVVLINYTRRHMAQAIPASVPVVCWVQDRMPHLFDGAVGASQGELDFLAGHLHPDLFTHFNYPRTRRVFAFVPASARRFSPPRTPYSEKRDEVAYVSHQSETPERFHARMKPMFATAPQVVAAMDPMFAAASAWMDAAEANPKAPRPDRKNLVNEALAGAGLKAPDERLVLTVFGNYFVPLIERMARHRSLLWAANACGRLGLWFQLYGKGWESHPLLGAHAAGELPHDERALPDTYHRCLAHLHVSINTNAHQRVAECALSGGLMLRRGPTPDADLAKVAMMRTAVRKPPIGTTPQGVPIYECTVDDGVDPLKYEAAFGRPPRLAPDGPFSGRPSYRKPISDADRKAVLDNWPDFPIQAMPDFAFDHAYETLFHSEAELEAMLARAMNDPDWRESVIASHRDAALQHCTHDRFTSDLLSLLRTSLAAAGS